MAAPYLGFMVITVNRFSKARLNGPLTYSECGSHRLACMLALSGSLQRPLDMTPHPTPPHPNPTHMLQFASKLVSTVEGMDATGFASGESGWAGGGGGGDDDAGEWK